ncbi:MAG: biosynthetic-type acetolactate synthase large subunit [Peptococcaceae bacterium]|nr:biosynthetic-type acetolactate synthase large subunit [Peptococcaceae bacterium]
MQHVSSPSSQISISQTSCLQTFTENDAIDPPQQKADSPQHSYNGAKCVFRILEEQGVEVIFGYPGGAVLPLYDALRDSSIRHVLPRHEQAAVHAADAYARASGKVGVCLGTSGPGAANLVTGIANAYMDSIPLVAITGQVPTHLLGSDCFQEVDITGITMPITKHSYLVKDVKDLPRIMREAFHIARTGRPGPVLIDIPRDVQAAPLPTPENENKEVSIKSYRFFSKGNAGQIEEAAKALMKSHKPLIYAGGGIITSGAADILAQLVDTLHLPIVTTLMGIGSIPSNHTNYLGMVGMHGTVTANFAVTDCDLLLAVGVRFDDRVTSGLHHHFATNATIIHIDIDPAEIGKVIVPDIPIVGDARLVLEDLLTKVVQEAGPSNLKPKASGLEPLTSNPAPQQSRLQPPTSHLQPWWQIIRTWQQDHPLCYENPTLLNPQHVLEAMVKVGGPNTIVVTDVGQHQMWAAQLYQVQRARQFITSAGLGTMGFGLPASIGAQLACPDKTVFLVTGDGSLQMTIQELATTVQNKLPVKIILMNNGVLGMVRQLQSFFHEERFSQIQLKSNPDFVKIADAYGIKGFRVHTPEDMEPILRQALAEPGPVLMDCLISPDETVWPMVPPGKAIHEMMLGE